MPAIFHNSISKGTVYFLRVCTVKDLFFTQKYLEFIKGSCADPEGVTGAPDRTPPSIF